MPEYLESLLVLSQKEQYILYITILHIIRKRIYTLINVSEQLDACFFRILTVQIEWNYLTSRVLKMEAADSWEMSVTVNRQDVQSQKT
jgi:uncharacterized membrane protein